MSISCLVTSTQKQVDCIRITARRGRRLDGCSPTTLTCKRSRFAKERGREIRAAFVPRDEKYRILAADYSQIELRVMAALSGDEGMLEAFNDNDADIHADDGFQGLQSPHRRSLT